MDCNRVREKLIDYADGCLPPTERAYIDGHLSGCYLCQEQHGEIFTLLNTCRLVLRHPHPVNRFRNLRARLSAVEAPRHAGAVRRQWRRRMVVRQVALVAAATLILMWTGPYLAKNAYATLDTIESLWSMQPAHTEIGQREKSPRFTRPFVERKDKIVGYLAALSKDAPERPNLRDNDALIPASGAGPRERRGGKQAGSRDRLPAAGPLPFTKA